MLLGTDKIQSESSSIWSRSGCIRRTVLLFAILLCIPISRFATADQNPKNVLLLYSFSRANVVDKVDGEETLKSALRARAPWQLNFGVEFIESRRFTDPGYENTVVETMEHTYKGQKFDLVMLESYPALEFAVKHRDELFPGTPIVFYGVDTRRFAGQKVWPGVTGVLQSVPVQKTIDLAFHLHPDTNTVAIITNVSEFENFWLADLHAELARSRKNVEVVDLIGLSAAKLFERVAALPPHAIVFFQRGPQSAIQPAIGDFEMLAWVGQRIPTYCIFPEICLNHGGIGGVAADDGVSTGVELARRVLSGEQVDHIPVVTDPRYQVQVDWRQLRYWKIPVSALPPGSVVTNRPLTLWQRDRRYIIPAVALIIAQALLIAGLLWQHARKRKAEAVLRESEERFRVMADTTPSLVWMCDARGKITYLNERRTAFTGSDPNAGYGDSWTTYVHPDDLRSAMDMVSQGLQNKTAFSREYRLRRSDGVYRWMFDVASPRTNGDGSFAGFIGSAIDITDQKLAQQALEQVSGQLIEAQEKERTRIARDLHDDICQRLALLSMELEKAKRASRGRVSPTKSLEEIRQHCSEIAGDVQSLSHQLHSSKLDLLGIVAAIRGFCRELSKQHGVIVDFSDVDVPRMLPKDVSLCLFRVAQESLHNAVKYSGTNRVKVQLSATGNEARLQVRDEGAGFDVERAKNRGLGLVSMQERIHLVRGRFSVESKPGAGTTILVSVPILVEKEVVTEDDSTRETVNARELR